MTSQADRPSHIRLCLLGARASWEKSLALSESQNSTICVQVWGEGWVTLLVYGIYVGSLGIFFFLNNFYISMIFCLFFRVCKWRFSRDLSVFFKYLRVFLGVTVKLYGIWVDFLVFMYTLKSFRVMYWRKISRKHWLHYLCDNIPWGRRRLPGWCWGRSGSWRPGGRRRSCRRHWWGRPWRGNIRL